MCLEIGLAHGPNANDSPQKPAGLAGCSSFARADAAGGLGVRAKCYDVDPYRLYRLYRLYRHQLTSLFGDQLKAEEL
jgi:hypothetical protein